MSWERVRELFAACADRSAAERDILLAGESTEVRDEIESLIAADENAGSFLAGHREKPSADPNATDIQAQVRKILIALWPG